MSGTKLKYLFAVQKSMVSSVAEIGLVHGTECRTVSAVQCMSVNYYFHLFEVTYYCKDNKFANEMKM